MRLRRLLLAVLLVPSWAWAATTYIDPTCTHNGDGTTTACAASAAAVGAMNAWPLVTGAGNSFLQKKGTISLAQVSVNSGSAGNPVTLGAYGTGAKPIIRSEENATTGTIKINTDAANITIDGLEVHGQLNLGAGVQANAIRNNTTAGSASVVVNITVKNCTIGPVVGYGGADDDDGIDLRGQGLIIQDNTFVSIANDGLWLASDGAVNDVVVRGNTCSLVAQVGTNGDCYQVAGTSTGMLIEENYCDHTNTDVKQCIVANSDVDIRYNDLYGFVGATVNSLIYCDVGPCRIYGNTTRNGKIGIQNNGTTGGATYSNVVTTPATYGIEVTAPSSPVYNNTVDGIGSGSAAIRMTAAATNGTAWNNILSDTDEGIRLTSASGHTESNNLFHGTVTTRVYDTTTAGSIAATNPVNATSQFVSEGTDYRTIAGSTARRAGLAWAGCLDLRGRVCNIPPDIGAYQASSGDQANTRTAASTRSAATTRTAASARTARD